ncbi:30S ribosomal protein S4e [Candidatus Woesearchaeota archaeon]|nr:30S ribosomal protein S4e [Candidatus Woesearchaeota archaeon]
MKNHLKRIASPKTWIIDRKQNVFILRPNAGGHPLEQGMALGVVLRDLLNLASTMHEIHGLLQLKEVLVDGKRQKDHRSMVGLFDVIAVPELKSYSRLVLDLKGRLVLAEIPASESNMKISKIVNKSALPGGKIQFNLYDGKNIISTQKAKVGDSLVLGLPKLEVKKVLPLQVGASVFLTKGKYGGSMGTLKEIKGTQATYTSNGQNVETAKEYLFVVGEKKPEMHLSAEKLSEKK